MLVGDAEELLKERIKLVLMIQITLRWRWSMVGMPGAYHQSMLVRILGGRNVTDGNNISDRIDIDGGGDMVLMIIILLTVLVVWFP